MTPFDPYDETVLYGEAPTQSPAYTSPPGYQSLEWWQARGVGPEEMFGPDGQLLSNWTHTANGYAPIPVNAQAPIPPSATAPSGGPPAAPRGGMSEQEGRDYDAKHGLVGGYMTANGWVSGSPWGGGGGGSDRVARSGGGELGGLFGGAGRSSAFLPYPEYESPGAFRFDPFTPSSWADAENEPGYRASREQLRRQVEAGAAHRGILRSGMTLGDIYTNLDALGQQNFAQFDQRRARDYGLNRETALLGYQSRATDVDRRNNYRFNVADRSFADSLARWQEQVRSLTQLARPVE